MDVIGFGFWFFSLELGPKFLSCPRFFVSPWLWP